MKGISSSLTWTFFFIVLAFIAVAAANTFFLSSVSQILCPMDQYEKQMTKAYKERVGTPPAKRNNKSVKQIDAKIMRCTGWTRNLIEGICLFLVGAGTTYGLSSMYWYLYVLLVPLALNIKRIVFAILGPMETPLGQNILYTGWYQSLGLVLFITSLAGGCCYVYLVEETVDSEVSSDDKPELDRIDEKWWVYFDDEVIDRKYSRRELADLKLLNEDLQVCRVGNEEWVRAEDDPLLQKLFVEPESSESARKLRIPLFVLAGLAVSLVATVSMGGIGETGSINSEKQTAEKSKNSLANPKASNKSEFQLDSKRLCDPLPVAGQDEKREVEKKGIPFTFDRFFEAVENKNQKLAQKFAKGGIKDHTEVLTLHDREVRGATILHALAARGSSPITDKLLDCFPHVSQGGYPNGSQKTYESRKITPMYFAAYHGNVQMVKKLLRKGGRVNYHYAPKNRDPLHYALLGGHEEVAKLLLQAGAKANPEKDTSVIDRPLDLAVAQGNSNIVALLENHIEKYELSNPSRTSLDYSEINSCDMPLEYKVTQARGQLKSKNTPVNFDSFIQAVEDGNGEIIDHLLTAGILKKRESRELGQYSYKDVTLFHVLAEIDFQPISQDVLQCYRKMDNVNKYITPLHFAAYYGNFGLIKELLSRRLLRNFDSRDSNGLRPLHFAVYGNNPDIVRFLLLRGAKPGPVQSRPNEKSALEIAHKKGYDEIHRMIKKAIQGKMRN